MIATRRLRPALIAIAAVQFVLLGCDSRDAKSGLTVGFSQIGAESGWRTAETKSVRDEADKRGVDLKFADAQQKQENQIKSIRTFIQQRADAIVLAPVVETGWEPVLKEAKQANIPVILADRSVNVSDDSLYATQIGSDFVEEGRMAGKWLSDKLGNKGNVVELQGTPGSSAALDRQKGFMEVIGQHSDIKVIKSQTGEFTRAKGKEVMEAFLKAEGKNINAVYAHNDDMALGAVQAIEEAGFKPGADITIISIDGVHDAFQAMVDGKLNATVECNPLLGPAIFDAIAKVKAGETLPKKTIVKDNLYDQSTAKEVMPSRQY